MRAFLMALVMGLSVPALAEEPPTPAETEEATTVGAPVEDAAPVAEDATPAGEDEPKEDVVLEVPDDIPVPETDEEALEQGASLVSSLQSKQWWLAIVFALGLGVFIGRKFLAAKADDNVVASTADDEKTDAGA